MDHGGEYDLHELEATPFPRKCCDLKVEPIIRTALEEFRVQRLRMTTGYSDLDSLIGGIETGSFYLFYGDPEALDNIAHLLLVNCVMPAERGGFEAKALYFNSTDYYVGKTVIDPSKLGMMAKRAGIEPSTVLENVEVAAAFNEDRQLHVSREAAKLIRESDGFKLILAHNITRFQANSRRPRESSEVLKRVVGELWRAASEKNVAFVATAEAEDGRSIVPRPPGGIFLRQAASIIAHFRRFYSGTVSSYKVTLVKHPCKKTPDTIILYVGQEGSMDLLTGKSVPSFQQLYSQNLDSLRRLFQNSLLDLGHRSAFETLVREAWNVEQKVLSSLKDFTILDGLNLTASLNTRAHIESLDSRLNMLNDRLKKISAEVESVKDRLHGRRRRWAG